MNKYDYLNFEISQIELYLAYALYTSPRLPGFEFGFFNAPTSTFTLNIISKFNIQVKEDEEEIADALSRLLDIRSHPNKVDNLPGDLLNKLDNLIGELRVLLSSSPNYSDLKVD